MHKLGIALAFIASLLAMPTYAQTPTPFRTIQGSQDPTGPFAFQTNRNGQGEIDLYNMPNTAASSFCFYQAITSFSQTQLMCMGPNGATFNVPFGANGGNPLTGAKCDGVTDDTAAIQAGINLAAANGKILLLPAATCNFFSPLSFAYASGWGIAGLGKMVSTLNYTGASTTVDLLAFGDTGIVSNHVQMTGFRVTSSTTMTAGVAFNSLTFQSTNGGGTPFAQITAGSGATGGLGLSASAASAPINLTPGAGAPVTLNNAARVPAVAIASLPTCNAALAGAQATVNNGNAPTYLGAVGTTGTVTVAVFCNGSAWVYD